MEWEERKGEGRGKGEWEEEMLGEGRKGRLRILNFCTCVETKRTHTNSNLTSLRFVSAAPSTYKEYWLGSSAHNSTHKLPISL